jgi:hypothetical protein
MKTRPRTPFPTLRNHDQPSATASTPPQTTRQFNIFLPHGSTPSLPSPVQQIFTPWVRYGNPSLSASSPILPHPPSPPLHLSTSMHEEYSIALVQASRRLSHRSYPLPPLDLASYCWSQRAVLRFRLPRSLPRLSRVPLMTIIDIRSKTVWLAPRNPAHWRILAATLSACLHTSGGS